jgi:PAS domain S-box-containing protein
MPKLSGGIMSEVEKVVRENPDAAVSLMDLEGLCCYWSPSAQSMFGYSAQDLLDAIGRHYSQFTDPRELARNQLAYQDALLNGESINIQSDVKLKSGGYRRMSGTGRQLVDESTGDIYVLFIGRPLLGT